MYPLIFDLHRRTIHVAVCMLFIASGIGSAMAQAQALATTDAMPTTLRQAFETIWSNQPEAAALSARRDAAAAQQRAAQSWTPEPVSVELDTTTDRVNRNLGTREYEVGIAVPLWLPGERQQSRILAGSGMRAVESRLAAARLAVAATVREAWWNLQRARAEVDTVEAELDSARRLADDVRRRYTGGDLAQGDVYQANGAVAAAESAVAKAQADVIEAGQGLRTLMAVPGLAWRDDQVDYRAEPVPGDLAVELDSHGELLALQDRAALAQATAALTATQSRANPELTLATIRDRGAFDERWQQTIRVGVRIPLGSGPRHEALAAAARAETVELSALLNLERVRLAGVRDAARARIDATRTQLQAAERRAQLARDSRGFFDKSFRAGETDLPTRLRIEVEAADAERQAVRARIELAAAISQWRQALGLLPE